MSWPAYPAYKDSGIDWIGHVPRHWTVGRLKDSVALCKNGVWGEDAQGDANDIPCVRVADFDRKKMRVAGPVPTIRNIVPGDRRDRVLLNGDLLLEKSGGGEKQPVGFVVLYDADKEAVCANFIARMVLNSRMNSSYWRYVHAAIYSCGGNVRSIKQTSGIQNIDQESYLNESIAYPDEREQKLIADFLDHETARIDALIEEQQRLIDLLQEKRQAVISYAVTKGLDHNVSMEESGIDWIGNIPRHWSVGALGYLAKIDTGATPDRSKAEYWNGDIPWVKTGEVNYGTIYDTEEYITIEGLNTSAARLAPKGTLLMAMYGQGVTRGRVALLGTVAAYNQACAAIQPGPKMASEYLMYYLVAAYPYIRDAGNETSQMNLSSGLIAKAKIVVPPVLEQRDIVEQLNRELPKFDDAVREIRSAIQLMRERRSALISATVTGKTDVRGWKPQDAPVEHELPKAAEAEAQYG